MNKSQSTYHLGGIVEKYNNALISKKVSTPQIWDDFSNEDEILFLFFYLKFNDSGCPGCGVPVVENYKRSASRKENDKASKSFKCCECGNEIFPLSGSLFSGTHISVSSIFYAIYALTSLSGLSTEDLSNHIGVSYKKTHELAMKIRSVMWGNYDNKMTGVVEIDEVFVGSGATAHGNKGAKTKKQIVIGIYERGTKQVRLFHVKDRNRSTLTSLVTANVKEGSTIYTDSWLGYNGLGEFYTHETVDHTKREYVRGNVTTNRIEGFWSVFKRNLRRSHVKITEKYLFAYINEAQFKFNNRGKTSFQKIDIILKRALSNLYISGGRLERQTLSTYQTFQKQINERY